MTLNVLQAAAKVACLSSGLSVKPIFQKSKSNKEPRVSRSGVTFSLGCNLPRVGPPINGVR